jgi:hypothetical protein
MEQKYTNAIVTLQSVVDGMIFKQWFTKDYEPLLMAHIIDAYTQLNLIAIEEEGNVIEKNEMDSNDIIYLSDDVIRVNKVCIPLNGKLWPLTIEDDIVPTTSEENGAEILDDDWGEGVDVIDRGVNGSEHGGSNAYGYYTVDYLKRRIICRNVTRSEVLLDYDTSGIKIKETTYIPAFAKKALEYGVRLDIELGQVSPNSNNVLIYQDQFERQKDICRSKSFNMTEFMDLVYSSFTPGIKRKLSF